MEQLDISNLPKDSNILALGDNTQFMQTLLEQGFGGRLDFVYIDPPFFTGKVFDNYSDKWEDGMQQFLDMLRENLSLIKELMAGSGLVAVHLDYHAVHYAKVLMDEIFGMKNFVNEVIWAYKSGGATKRSFARKHDNILLYSKSKDYYFNPQKEVSYNREGKPYHFKGVDEYQDENGRWYTLVNRKDVLNIDMVGRTSAERTGYSTQKPEALLKVLIACCCPPGGITADFFAGSGTTGAAAQALGMRWILCDENPDAIEICRKRLGACVLAE